MQKADTPVKCEICGGRWVFFGRVSALGREPGVQFFRCEGCAAMAEELMPPPSPAQPEPRP